MSDKKTEPFLEIKAYSGDAKTKTFAYAEVTNKEEYELALSILASVLASIVGKGEARMGSLSLLFDVLGITDDDFSEIKKRIKKAHNNGKGIDEALKIIQKSQNGGQDDE
ncbi:hypothetical protein M3M38_07300 [Fructilactobacillus cliffordii]|uniref:hypothetical protein n=1 Tax=Fructilactobacillus cliffordii TaxID=2940299 RepID=UPI002091F050|nr:hypothetical protein [Fructilactobacillus cliffordii]USS86465.1 hypothetical protein M3M38_07300 [Fructilactobacillus cliffordii]